jgi:hypothetical protein
LEFTIRQVPVGNDSQARNITQTLQQQAAQAARKASNGTVNRPTDPKGVVMTLMSLVHDYAGLLSARIFLGVTEAGLFPGVAYYLTNWDAVGGEEAGGAWWWPSVE